MSEAEVGPFAEDSPLMQARVRFWICPRGHSKTTFRTPLRVTVEWDADGIAHCTTPGCPETSAPPASPREEPGDERKTQ